ncbi:unnamed protein product [Boreogadus saida]
MLLGKPAVEPKHIPIKSPFSSSTPLDSCYGNGDINLYGEGETASEMTPEERLTVYTRTFFSFTSAPFPRSAAIALVSSGADA